MKNRKLFSLLIAICSCITLISVGFASWTIVNSSSSASGNITAEDIIYNGDYIVATKTQKLSFCQFGFVDSNYKKVNSSTLKIQVKLINLNDFKTKYANNNNLNVELNFITNILDSKLTLVNNVSSTSTIKPTNVINNKLPIGINTTFVLNNVLNNNEYVFEASYTLNYSGNENDFKNLYFNKLTAIDLFDFNVKIYNK